MNGHATNERCLQPEHDDIANFVVIDTQRCGHRESGEDFRLGQSLDCGFLHLAKVPTPVVLGTLSTEAIELQIDLNPVAMFVEQVNERVVASKLNTIAVDKNAYAIAVHQLLNEFGQVRMNGWLATTEHDDINPPVFASQSLVDICEHFSHRHNTRERGRSVRETHRALEVATFDDVFQKDAGVLGLHFAETLQICLRDGCKVAFGVRHMPLCWRGPLLKIGEDFCILFIHRTNETVRGAPAFQPDTRITLH